MELLFNELSIQPPCIDKYHALDRMNKFAETVRVAAQKRFNHIRSHVYVNQIALADDYSVHDWLMDRDVPKNHKDFLIGKFKYPFIKEEDEGIEEEYVNACYYFENEKHEIEKTECLGLASAYLYETLCVSLLAKPIWSEVKLPILIESEAGTLVTDVLNVSSKESFDDSEVSEFIDHIASVTLVESELNPNDKRIHLAHHHGQDDLQILCDRLKQSPYVVEMRSTDWGGRKFIRKVQKDGVVEVVLIRTQRQYALCVQTTGRNYRETEAIAKILYEKYA